MESLCDDQENANIHSFQKRARSYIYWWEAIWCGRKSHYTWLRTLQEDKDADDITQ